MLGGRGEGTVFRPSLGHRWGHEVAGVPLPRVPTARLGLGLEAVVKFCLKGWCSSRGTCKVKC